ncbi:MAG: hypothetical protein J5781_03625 [Clostridia bacterium]|nr:hypothetical protein [Clostridia bacterium]
MTKIVFAFDTEDFTNKKAADAILEEAEILRSEGVRGCFAVVGLLANQLREWERTDVIEALKHHEIDLHSLAHTMHPMINEYTDVEDFSEAKAEFLRQERYALKCLKDTFGIKKVFAAVPPGNQDSYVAMHGYAEMGIPVYSDSICDPDGNGLYYCNGFHTAYAIAMEDFLFSRNPFRIKSVLNKMAGRDIAVIYTHPHRAMYSQSWDILNYDKKNLREFGDWIESKRWSTSKTARFYKNFRKLIQTVKKDKRFLISTFEEIAEDYCNKQRVMTVEEIPYLYKTLSDGLQPTKKYSLCDMFFACAEFMQGKRTYTCGPVYGPMYKPQGIVYPVTLTPKEVFESARAVDPSAPIPSRIQVGKYLIGPADWLYAAVNVLCGSGTVELQPRDQLPDLSDLPKIKNCSFKGTWRHSDAFKDAYLSDRLRYQSWTMRYPR